jgi:hypothetical protein
MTGYQGEESPASVPVTIVARGISPFGRAWCVESGGTNDHYYTTMNIELSDGRTIGGGIGGPPLWPDRLMNCSVHWYDRQVHYLVGRAVLSVDHLHLDFAHGYPDGLDLQPIGTCEQYGLTLFGEELPRSTEVVDISAWDNAGHCLERKSTAHYSVMAKKKRKDLPL